MHGRLNKILKLISYFKYLICRYSDIEERISKILQRENIRVSFKSTHTLQHEFPKPKDKLDPKDTRDIVYKIKTIQCGNQLFSH